MVDEKKPDEPVYVQVVNTEELKDEMPKQDWAPEPWRHIHYDLHDANNMPLSSGPENLMEEADLDRIKACVNALKGIPTETLKHFGNSGIWNFEKVDGMQMFSLTINGGSRLPDIDLNEFNEEASDE